MNTLNADVEGDGPLVDVLVGLSAHTQQALRNAGRPVPAPVSLRALIDTGAEVTCIDPRLLSQLVAAGLKHVRFVFSHLPAIGAINFAVEYAVSLSVVHQSGNPKNNLVLRNHPVIEQPLGAVGYQALLGRDVLDHCILVYNGPGRSLILGY